MDINSNNIVINLLVLPRLRILRHLILFALASSISASFIWELQDKGMLTTPLEMYKWLLLFGILIWGISCINIYVLTPKLVLKNKWKAFLFLLSVFTLSLMIIIILVQTVVVEREDDPFDTSNAALYDFIKVFINILSASFSFFLLFVGTSTFVLFKKWILDMKQSEELESATLQLELKLLENQINPHFLFNMLNNANIMVKRDPDTAIHIITKLEELLRYLMNDSVHEKVYLKDEIVFLNDFLELEQTRRDSFTYQVCEKGKLDEIQVAPLLFITFVENAVKHNQDSRATSYVNISFEIVKGRLVFVCENSIPQKASSNEVGGIGLVNIKRRLDLLYKGDYSLEQAKTDMSYTVKLELKL